MAYNPIIVSLAENRFRARHLLLLTLLLLLVNKKHLHNICTMLDQH